MSQNIFLSFMSQCKRTQLKEPSTRLLPLTHTVCQDCQRPESCTQALPAPIGGTFPSSKMRRHQQSWHTHTHTHYLTLPVQVWSWKPHAGQGIIVSSGVQLKISKNSCGRDEAWYNLWAFMLRLEVHMPTSGRWKTKLSGYFTTESENTFYNW